MYHIILNKEEDTPLLCDIRQKPGVTAEVCPETKFTSSGRIVYNELAKWLVRNPKIRVMNKAIMPDHVHIMLRVMERLDEPLGVYIAYFTGACSAAINPQGKKENPEAFKSFFTPEFVDVLIDERDQRDICFRYVSDNPKRYLVRKLFPEYFRSKLRLLLPWGEYALYGNPYLLSHPCKSVVRESRRFSKEYKLKLKAEWREIMRVGGVLVSPFIHDREKDVMREGMSENTGIILVATNGFPERFKPPGAFFEHCSKGKLLIVAPLERRKKDDISYEEAQVLNRFAEALARLKAGEYRIRRL